MKAYYSPTSKSRAAAHAEVLSQNISRVTANYPRSPNKARNLAPIVQPPSANSDVHGHTHISMRSSPRRDSPQLIKHSKSQIPESTSPSAAEEVILIEDFDAGLDSEFLNEVVKPYFKTIFTDVAMRRHSPKKTGEDLEFVDKVAFFEYTQLPGIINDRFFSQFRKTSDDHIYEAPFIEGMIKVYLSTFDEKMRMTFKMYDFDNDGVLQREDVRILLSYVPFKTDQDMNVTQSVMSDQQNKEGLYDSTRQSFYQRKTDQDEIIHLVDTIFGARASLNFEDYSQINQNITSEMFTSIMRVLHEMLPCSRNFFSMKRKYRFVQQDNEEAKEEGGGRRIREIASPRIVRGLSLGKSPSRRPSSRGFSQSSNGGLSQRFSQMQLNNGSPDVRVKKNMGRDHVRNSSRQNKALGSSNTGNFLPELTDVQASRDANRSPLTTPGSPKKLNMQAKLRGGRNGAPMNLNVDTSTSVFSEFDSRAGSPITPSKTFALRSFKRADLNNRAGSTPQDLSQGLSSTLSPNTVQLNRFQINLQTQQDMSMREANSTLGNRNGAKLLPFVNTTSGSALQSQRKGGHQNLGNRSNTQGYDNSILSHSPHRQMDTSSAMEKSQQPAQIVLEGFGGFEDVASDEEIEELSGFCYLKTKTESYKKHWMVLQGNELRFYRKQGDEEHKVMHCLSGTYLKEVTMDEISEKSKSSASKSKKSGVSSKRSGAAETEGSRREKQAQKAKSFHPVKLVIPPNKSRLVFFSKEEDQRMWVNRLKIAMGNVNVFQFYQLDKTLGKGQFGLVKLAVHKQTSKRVAIKQVKKKNMTHIEVFQQRREIEVLKMCQHPNIINLVDLFENSDYYYIVLDYMAGSDLFDYLQGRDFNLGEDRVRELTYQLALGLKYLHNYGIVHRDLKLENIMMTDTQNNSVPKLVDFGLAKMIGPNERATEPFGTLGYVAPEILEKKPYTFSCDLWSLGCIVYALLCSSLPFDHDSQKETIRMTCEDAVVFDSPQWSSYSQECQDLIGRLLIKRPEERINLDEVLAHTWFRKVRAKYEKNESSSPRAAQRGRGRSNAGFNSTTTY